MKSHAIVFTAPNVVNFWEYDVPALRPGEMLVKTMFSGVSQGTEIWDLIGKRPELSYPNVPGYQSVGSVIEVADGGDTAMIGKTVRFIRSRLEAPFTDSWMNGHVSHAVVKDDVLVVPGGVDPMDASLSCMPAVGLLGNRMTKITIGDVVLVIGQGMIGQGVAQLARARGATVIAADISSARLELSRKYSADYAVNPSTDDLEAAVKQIKPGGVDVAIDTTGRSSMFQTLVKLIRTTGQIVLQGWYPDPISFDFHETHLKRPSIHIPCGQAMDDTVLDMLKHRKIHLHGLISHVENPTKPAAIYERMTNADPGIMGVVFDWSKI